MKPALLTFLMLFPTSVFASGVICQPDAHETQLRATWDSSRVSIEVINPDGYSAMPQLENASENLLPFLKMQADDLRSLNDHFAFEWDRKDCAFSAKDPWIFECHGPSKTSQTDVAGLGIATSRVHEEGLDVVQDTYKVLLILLKSNTYFVALPTATRFCQGF